MADSQRVVVGVAVRVLSGVAVRVAVAVRGVLEVVVGVRVDVVVLVSVALGASVWVTGLAAMFANAVTGSLLASGAATNAAKPLTRKRAMRNKMPQGIRRGGE